MGQHHGKGGEMDVLQTRLIREYEIRYPFVGAGMGFVSLAPLAAAVSAAGGMGMDRFAAMIRDLPSRTDNPLGVDLVVGASSAETRAAVDAGVDGLIVQGAQAGGHNRSTTPSERLPALAADADGRLLLAGGVIADGRAAARALSAGADGVWVGTRLLASQESNAQQE